jgi:Uma2 family endonuclease
MRRKRPRHGPADYWRLPEESRTELIQGELFYSPRSEDARHQQLVCNLLGAIQRHVERRKLGEVLTWVDVCLPTGDILQPDVFFVSATRSDIVKDCVRGSPDLVVEVVSPDSKARDVLVKPEIYRAGGVRELWIVEEETMSVDVRGKRQAFFQHGDRIRSAVLPEMNLTVSQVFAGRGRRR